MRRTFVIVTYTFIEWRRSHWLKNPLLKPHVVLFRNREDVAAVIELGIFGGTFQHSVMYATSCFIFISSSSPSIYFTSSFLPCRDRHDASSVS